MKDHGPSEIMYSVPGQAKYHVSSETIALSERHQHRYFLETMHCFTDVVLELIYSNHP